MIFRLKMPIRKPGDPIAFYVEEEMKWYKGSSYLHLLIFHSIVSGSIVRYIRGFGYVVEGTVDEKDIQGWYLY